MAGICNTCLRTGPTTRGMCPTCNRADNRTRRPPSSQRYPVEYRANRKIILRGDPVCYWCGAPATTADHVTPRARGGNHSLENLRPSCLSCNSSRGAHQVNPHKEKPQ